jgi:hypothetical protein
MKSGLSRLAGQSQDGPARCHRPYVVPNSLTALCSLGRAFAGVAVEVSPSSLVLASVSSVTNQLISSLTSKKRLSSLKMTGKPLILLTNIEFKPSRSG